VIAVLPKVPVLTKASSRHVTSGHGNSRESAALPRFTGGEPMAEWQSIDSAPLEADVRVQARDPLGTYVLSFFAV
jgi:hypothetical protein